MAEIARVCRARPSRPDPRALGVRGILGNALNALYRGPGRVFLDVPTGSYGCTVDRLSNPPSVQRMGEE